MTNNKKRYQKKPNQKNMKPQKKRTRGLWFLGGGFLLVILVTLFAVQKTVEEDKNVAGLPAGTKAPDFTLETTEGEFSLSDHEGKNVVIYFYEGNT